MARPDYVSVSQVNTFLSCPRKFRLRYVDGAEPERRSVHLAFGSAVHSAISWWLEERIAGRDPDPSITQRTFRADWNAQLADPVLDLEDRDPDQLQALGSSLVMLFAERFAQEEVRAVDERVEARLVDPRTGSPLELPLVGFLDLSGDRWVGEIKTVGRRTSPMEWSLQLSAYALAWRERTGVRPRMRVIELVKTAEPKLLVEEVTITDRDEAWFLEVVSEVVEAANNNVYYPNPSWRCGTCEYRRACRRPSG